MSSDDLKLEWLPRYSTHNSTLLYYVLSLRGRTYRLDERNGMTAIEVIPLNWQAVARGDEHTRWVLEVPRHVAHAFKEPEWVQVSVREEMRQHNVTDDHMIQGARWKDQVAIRVGPLHELKTYGEELFLAAHASEVLMNG